MMKFSVAFVYIFSSTAVLVQAGLAGRLIKRDSIAGTTTQSSLVHETSQVSLASIPASQALFEIPDDSSTSSPKSQETSRPSASTSSKPNGVQIEIYSIPSSITTSVRKSAAPSISAAPLSGQVGIVPALPNNQDDPELTVPVAALASASEAEISHKAASTLLTSSTATPSISTVIVPLARNNATAAAKPVASIVESVSSLTSSYGQIPAITSSAITSSAIASSAIRPNPLVVSVFDTRAGAIPSILFSPVSATVKALPSSSVRSQVADNSIPSNVVNVPISPAPPPGAAAAEVSASVVAEEEDSTIVILKTRSHIVVVPYSVPATSDRIPEPTLDPIPNPTPLVKPPIKSASAEATITIQPPVRTGGVVVNPYTPPANLVAGNNKIGGVVTVTVTVAETTQTFVSISTVTATVTVKA